MSKYVVSYAIPYEGETSYLLDTWEEVLDFVREYNGSAPIGELEIHRVAEWYDTDQVVREARGETDSE